MQKVWSASDIRCGRIRDGQQRGVCVLGFDCLELCIVHTCLFTRKQTKMKEVNVEEGKNGDQKSCDRKNGRNTIHIYLFYILNFYM
mgnify:CR=1 FL=1